VVDAESFYQTMPKPEPGGDNRLLAQAKLIEAPPAPPPAPRGPDEAEAQARRFFGQGAAQDRAEPAGRENVRPESEATPAPPDDAQREHAERNQRQEEMAERLYGDLPNGDGVRYDEVELSSPTEFALEVPDDLAANLADGEAQQIVSAFIESGVGRTMAIDLLRQGIEASRRGPLSDDQVQERNASSMQDLQAKWGDKAGQKIQLAKGMIDAAERKWPGVKAYLNATGLGSDPKLIQQLVARAERRPGRNR
jgi:hypothetical protein